MAAFGSWSVLKTPEYRATGTLQVMPEGPSVPGVGADAPLLGALADPIRSEMEIVRSRTLLDAVTDEVALMLDVTDGFYGRDVLFPGLVVTGEARPGAFSMSLDASMVEIRDAQGTVIASGPPGTLIDWAGVSFLASTLDEPTTVQFLVRDRRTASEALLASLVVAPVRETNLIRVDYVDDDPELSARVVNTLMDLARGNSIARLRQQASARLRFIEGQLVDFESQLEVAQADVQSYQEEIGVLSVEAEEAGHITNILEFERDLEELRLERELYLPVLRWVEAPPDQRQAMDDAALQRMASTPALVTNPAIADLYGRIATLEEQRDSLLSDPAGAGPLNRQVQAVQRQLEGNQVSLAEAVGEYVAGLDRRMSALANTVERLRSESEARLPHATELSSRLRRVESLQRIHETLRTQLEQTRIDEAAESGRLSVIDAAVVPHQPANGTGPIEILLALVVAFTLGVGGGLVRDNLDDRVRSPEDVLRLSRLAVLGSVPDLGRVPGGAKNGASTLVVRDRPDTVSAEAYRMVRTNLRFSASTGDLSTLLVTSPGPQDGKTTTAANLAVSFAQQGASTVLVDADLRRGSLHRVLGIAAAPGLVEYLRGEQELEGVLVSTGVERLDAVPAGELLADPTELLEGRAFQTLLASLRERYERIVVDSPPLLAVADGAILARELGATVLVVRAGQTHHDAVTRAVEQLAIAEANVLGVVVNAVRLGPGYRSQYFGYAVYGADG